MKVLEIFLHPRRAGRLIKDLLADNDAAQQDNENLARRLSQSQDEIDRLSDRVIEYQTQVDSSNEAVRALNDDLLRVRKRLDRANFDILQMDALRNDLANAVAEKKDALRRVETLKRALEESRKALRKVTSLPSGNELVEADVKKDELQFPELQGDGDEPKPVSGQPKTPVSDVLRHDENLTDGQDDDWLRPLPPSQL
ncbi:MAG: hypothetical protein NC201_00535 [Prevotella sp.]|nr:hypothetical protein [Bacteroides sp.]MCM1365714.1 hypothetical protein [Prevotella sp.]MCM1436384.1 hypothetical protein [Prevotella sp.]